MSAKAITRRQTQNLMVVQARDLLLKRIDVLEKKARVVAAVYTEQWRVAAEQVKRELGVKNFNKLMLKVRRKEGSLQVYWSGFYRDKDKKTMSWRDVKTIGHKMSKSNGRAPRGEDKRDAKHYSMTELRKIAPQYAHAALQQAEAASRTIREEASGLNAIIKGLNLDLVNMDKRVRRCEKDEATYMGDFDYTPHVLGETDFYAANDDHEGDAEGDSLKAGP